MAKHRNSEVAGLRARLVRMRDAPQREHGFTTRDWIDMYGLKEYWGRETFVRAINEHIESLGYQRHGVMWVRRED